MGRIIWSYNNSREHLIRKLKKQGYYVILIEGEQCPSLQDYFLYISNYCGFPVPARSWDGYNDWMRDFYTIKEKKIALIIVDFKDLFRREPQAKAELIENFETVIFPWWDHEVVDCVVGGETKEFVVFFL